MERAVLYQCCTVTAFVEGIYCRVLQERESVIIDLISHLIEEKPVCFSLTLRRLMSYTYICICIYMEHPFLMFLDHTQRRSTVGMTPLDE